MEWVVLVLFALAAAALIALPAASRTAIDGEQSTLRDEHARLLRQLAELDADAAAGRISPDDRTAARAEIGPRLRAVTQQLRERGELPPQEREPAAPA